MTRPSHVLVVAGSDSSGGAGIAPDVATVSHFGAATSLAITAVTAQTHDAVTALHVMPASLVAAQMRAALSADPVAAIKIGMLATAEIVEAVADVLAAHTGIPVVLDPVIASTSGTQLLSDEGIACLHRKLLSLSLIVTPNLPELGILSGCGSALTNAEIAAQATRLLDHGPMKILVKGGHAEDPMSIDTLYSKGEPPRRFTSPRRAVAMRGTGCMLASAIAANLALGQPIETAVFHAKAFINESFDTEHRRLSN